MKVRICPACGKRNLASAWYCVNCGQTLSVNTLVEVDNVPSDIEESPQEIPLDIEGLLEDLCPECPYYDRVRAIEHLGKLHKSDPRIVLALLTAKESDPSHHVRGMAAELLHAPAHQRILQQRPDLMKAATSTVVSSTEQFYMEKIMSDAKLTKLQLTQQIQSYVTDLVQAAADAQFWRDQWLREAKAIYEAAEKVVDEVRRVTQSAGLMAAPWDDSLWQSWTAVTESSMPLFVRIGQLTEAGRWQRLDLPALLPLVGGGSVLLKCSGAARAPAVQALQSVLLRLLAAIPPNKLRFTFVDPVGLGQNVAAFLHLGDYNKDLITVKAWTDPQHIEAQLADLAEHMEMVIQTYLRNQFSTIEEYNVHAGEIAEPYRVLVAMDFPVNFSETAARRLVSIVQNGARCGVYAVVLMDTAQPLPHGFNLADLEQATTIIAWDGKRFVWQDEDFKDCLLELDEPPPAELLNRVLQSVGEVAAQVGQVEVPFGRVAPPSERWWTVDSSTTLHVPLGPIGARQVQNLELGQGTAQHVLVAGRTGSGKSTLLHVLITNLALAYSPQEVELFLVDFKKGVEFKTYATYELPHARVVAIESEREFGLSVLHGLDVELKRRGDLFRATGVDSLVDYRHRSGEYMPRVLLLVDEFQEFFTEDDSIASQAAQVLDRLVRQGRAFGIHVLLGSQTLAGAYSLARSTMDQMAVRIALQCSDADSRLILADDNAAARLLSRPGAAIYNDANGLVEGNHPFQVVWLPDDERDRYLGQVQTLVQKQGYRPPHPQIVFEGNTPAEVDKNRLLNDLLAAPDWSVPSRRVSAWLGDPIAIKEPTAAHFRRQSGSNLLIVGRDDEAAMGMLAAALIGLATQHLPPSRFGEGRASFYILDFSPADAPYVNLFPYLVRLLPHMSRRGGRRELPAIIAEVAAEVDRRLEERETVVPEEPTIFLCIFGLHRARDLRQEEDWGVPSFGEHGEEATPLSSARRFSTILQEGPDVGVHTLVWCDTYANLTRTLDRRSLREFEMRVVFQMSAEDSTNLVDTPAASRLGLYRALFYSEEEGWLEKFRPYGLPSAAWLQWVEKRFGEKGSAHND